MNPHEVQYGGQERLFYECAVYEMWHEYCLPWDESIGAQDARTGTQLWINHTIDNWRLCKHK